MSLDADESDNSDSSTSSSNSDSDSDSDTNSDTDSSSSSSGDESESSQSSGPEVVSSKPPYAGKKSTKARNKRRTLASKRRKLVERGLLPTGSTLEDARQYLKQADTAPEADTTKPVAQAPSSSNKMKRGGAELMPEERLQAGNELEERRRQLLAELNLDATSSETAKPGEDGKPVAAMEQPPAQEPVQEPARKRLRPNVSAIRRIISHQATVSIPRYIGLPLADFVALAAR